MIETIRRLFDNFKDIVYIVDLSDFSIIYMNKYSLELNGLGTEEHLNGQTCHKLFYGADEPCSFCQYASLEPGQYHESQYHNKLLNMDFSKKCTVFEHDGKRYLLGMSIDITNQNDNEKLIRSMMITEAMLNHSIAEALRVERPSDALSVFLRALGQKTRCERVYVFQQGDGDFVVNTYEWCAENVVSQKDNLQNVPMEVVQPWYDFFAQDKNIIITDVEAIKESNPFIYEYLKPQNIHSLVVSPLITEGKIIGFYGTDNPPAELMSHISEIAWTVGHFIVSLLKKSKLFEHLEELSYFDRLTGVLNRRAMEDRIEKNDTIDRFGIIYCDVMGLKKINDTYGHQTGDALLLRAANCLKKHFDRTEIHRIGGDEFLVMCDGIDQGDFNARIETLRADMAENNAMMALGCSWYEQAQDIEKIIIDADQLMYAEKQAYYANAAKAGLLQRRKGDRKKTIRSLFHRNKQ